VAKHFAFDLEIWLVMHESLRTNLRMGAAFDHLHAELAAYAGGRR
jgi:hypothetical protein